eukprot:g5621.t1
MWSLIRKDLGEFVTTLKDDAAVTIKSAMAHGETGEEEYDSSSAGSEGGDVKGRRQQRQQQPATAALRAMRADIKTYTEDIAESQSERLPAFLASFDLGARTKDIATLLKEDPVVAKIHTQLVPEHVTYDDFWARYFFRAERVASGKTEGGMSFPPDDEGEDEEEFGWGEDDQEDDAADTGVDPHPSATASPGGSPPARGDGTAGPAGGALGAMLPAASEAADPRHGLAPASEEAPGSGGMGTLASAAAMAEISRLTAALRASEAERASLAGAGGAGGSRDTAKSDDDDDDCGDDGKVEDLTRQRDAATVEATDLREKLRELEAKYSAAREACAAAEGDRERQRATAEESMARVAAAEEEARVHAGARADAEERAAAAAAALAQKGARVAEEEEEEEEEAGGAMAGKVAAAEAAAEEAQSELARLKKAFREERKEHEAMLLESRQAANEAVEAALSSADADREEACAELEAAMKLEAAQKDEELEALRAQLAKSAGAMEEVSTLRADLEDLRLAADKERKAAERAASEARQEADAAKQLREEIRVLRAAASRPVASPAPGRGAAPSATRRGNTLRSDIGAEDTDGWGEDEDDSCAASTNTNSSGVVVDRPQSSASPRFRDDGASRFHSGSSNHARVPSGDSGGGGGGGGGGALAGDQAPREGAGGSAEGEGDDGWEGWD